MQFAKVAARSLRVSRNSRIRPCASASPTPWPKKPSPQQSSTGRASTGPRIPDGWTGIGGCWQFVVPLLATIHAGGRYEVLGDGAVLVRWPLRAGDALVLAANLSATPARGFPAEPGRVLWQEGEVGHDGTFGPRTVQWSVEGLLRHEPASPALDDLAERMGIEPQFRNAKGEIVETSSETKRSLLAAMGVEAADEVQECKALEDLDRAEWLRPLSVVQVLRAEASPPAIELVLPAGTGEIAWS